MKLLLADEQAPAQFLIIYSLGGFLVGVAQPGIVFRMIGIGLGCAFCQPEVAILQVRRQVVGFDNFETVGL